MNYWVIREGMVHGQGRYFAAGRWSYTLDVDVTRYGYGVRGVAPPGTRWVKVTRKPKDNAAVLFAVARNARLLALAEAEQVCRERIAFDVTASCSTCVAVMTACANAIAALKGGAK